MITPLEEWMLLDECGSRHLRKPWSFKIRLEKKLKALQMLTPILSIVSLDKFKSEIYKEGTSIYSLRC